MKRTLNFLTISSAVALIACAGLSSCSKKPSSALIGTWVVRAASADTSDHSEKGLDEVVMASNLAQGATMTFTTDSITMVMPPDMNAREMHYSVMANGTQYIQQGKSGKLDTVDFKISMDTILEINRPSRHLKITLAKGSM